MKIEIENRIIESVESFETAIEIEKYITNFKDEKKEEFRTKIKKSIENGSFTLLDKVIHYEIVEDKEDFIFLGFTLINTNDYENNSINFENGGFVTIISESTRYSKHSSLLKSPSPLSLYTIPLFCKYFEIALSLEILFNSLGIFSTTKINPLSSLFVCITDFE